MDALFQLAAAEGAAWRGPPERVGKSLMDRTSASMSEMPRSPTCGEGSRLDMSS